MGDQEQRESRRVPVALRIRLRYRELDTFISKFATNISRGGMFISSRNPKEPGTELRFEIRLADDSPIISGRGVVKWVRRFDPEAPKAPHGMGIEFIRLAPEGRLLLERLIEERRRQGLGEEAIPHANGHRPRAPAPAAVVPPAVTTAAVPTSAIAVGDELPELSDESLERVLRRARAIAGAGDPEDSLADLSHAPTGTGPATVDGASEALARMLGGDAIKSRDRRDDAGRNGDADQGEPDRDDES